MERRRTVLEVLKWLGARDILQAGEIVSRAWRELANTDELWRSLYEDYFNCPCESPTPKSAYYADNLESSSLLMVRNRTVTLISVSKLPNPEAIRTISLCQDSGQEDSNAYCFLPGYKALRFGNEFSPEVQLIDLRTGTISLINPMNYPRLYPGIIRYQCYIYLFGCRTKTAEKLHLKTWKWEGIASVLAAATDTLTAARYLTSVFLICSVQIQVFALETEEFRILEVQAPSTWHYSLGLVDRGELVLLQNDVVGRLRLESEGKAFRVEQGTAWGDGYYTNCPPVWVKGVCYSLLNGYPDLTGVLAFDSMTDRLDKVLSFDDEIQQ